MNRRFTLESSQSAFHQDCCHGTSSYVSWQRASTSVNGRPGISQCGRSDIGRPACRHAELRHVKRVKIGDRQPTVELPRAIDHTTRAATASPRSNRPVPLTTLTTRAAAFNTRSLDSLLMTLSQLSQSTEMTDKKKQVFKVIRQKAASPS